MTTYTAIDWGDLPTKQTIVTGAGVASFKFTTTKSPTYKGYLSALANTGSSNLIRRIWISKKAGGKPIEQLYKGPGGVMTNACEVSGSTPKLSWSQEDNPRYPMTVKLERGKTYYLNYSQSAFNDGPAPTAKSSLIAAASTSGTP